MVTDDSAIPDVPPNINVDVIEETGQEGHMLFPRICYHAGRDAVDVVILRLSCCRYAKPYRMLSASPCLMV